MQWYTAQYENPEKKTIGTKNLGKKNLLDRMQCIGHRGLELSIPNCLTKVKISMNVWIHINYSLTKISHIFLI